MKYLLSIDPGEFSGLAFLDWNGSPLYLATLKNKPFEWKKRAGLIDLLCNHFEIPATKITILTEDQFMGRVVSFKSVVSVVESATQWEEIGRVKGCEISEARSLPQTWRKPYRLNRRIGKRARDLLIRKAVERYLGLSLKIHTCEAYLMGLEYLKAIPTKLIAETIK